MELAEKLNGEIIGCDSVQLYRGFDIGSAKPSKDDFSRIAHHLYDVFDWHEDCDAALYAGLARAALDQVRSRGRIPIVTGGTGLYLRALVGGGWNTDLPKDDDLRQRLQSVPSDVLYSQLRDLDPERAKDLHPNDRFRVIRALELVTLLGRPLREAGLDAAKPGDQSGLIVVLEPPRPILHERIANRTHQMLDQGLIGEVQRLLDQGVSPDCKPMRSIGYKEVTEFLQGAMIGGDQAELSAAIQTSTRQYAKRQCTWFRKVAADLRLEASDVKLVVDTFLGLNRQGPT
jgi:tRNA dimethylallyltransferase